MFVELIPSRKHHELNIDGYLYYFRLEQKGRTYWACERGKECSGRAITSMSGSEIIVHKGPEKSEHNHAPNCELADALKIQNNLKRHAREHPEAPPAQILRTQLQNVPSGTLLLQYFCPSDYNGRA